MASFWKALLQPCVHCWLAWRWPLRNRISSSVWFRHPIALEQLLETELWKANIRVEIRVGAERLARFVLLFEAMLQTVSATPFFFLFFLLCYCIDWGCWRMCAGVKPGIVIYAVNPTKNERIVLVCRLVVNRVDSLLCFMELSVENRFISNWSMTYYVLLVCSAASTGASDVYKMYINESGPAIVNGQGEETACPEACLLACR